MDEELLLRQLHQRKPEALEQLIRQYNSYVAAIIRGILGADARDMDVEELVSDVFVALWKHADALKPGSAKAYIGAAARNHAKSFLRKRQVLPMDLDELPPLPGGDSPEEQVLSREQARLVREAVEQMAEPTREIFLRYYYYFQSTAQFAQALHMEPGTVRARLMRGRNALKAAFWKEESL